MRPPADSYDRLRSALRGVRLPCALVDLDLFERNIAGLAAAVRTTGKTLRIASKSVRSPVLLERIAKGLGPLFGGVMAYTVEEAAFLAEEGFRDLLVAYPTLQPSDLDLLCTWNRRKGSRMALVVDAEAPLDLLARTAQGRRSKLPLVVEVDLSLRLLGGRIRIGVRRSPLTLPGEIVRLVRAIEARPGLRFLGVMGYEAQVAGMGEENPFTPLTNPLKRGIKRLSIPRVARLRGAIAEALRREGLPPLVFNGGGTGSLPTTGRERAVTELTAGSGFLCGHLFDYYGHLRLEPAALFALQAVRLPAPGIVTCLGGGYVASGEAGPDRLPRPFLPPGLRLLRFEGAGEVQTPVVGPGTARLEPGGPVFFRHAKSGELAEHFNEYHLIRGDRIVGRAPTYRGLGRAFL